MSKLDTFFGQMGSDYESMPPSEQDVNVSPSAWSHITFALGVGHMKAKQRPKIPAAQALPSMPMDSFLDSPRKNEYNLSWRASEEQAFYTNWPQLNFSEAEAFGPEIQAALALRSPSTDACCGTPWGKSCPLDRVGSEQEHSSSSNVTQDDPGSHTNLACPTNDLACDDREAEGSRETFLENNGDGEWDGVVKFVQELTTRFTDSNCAGNCAVNSVTKNVDPLKPEKTAEQLSPECTASVQALKSLETLSKPCCGMTTEEILATLSTIQRKMEAIKAAVPKIAKHKQNFTVLISRQCQAAAGAVKLISQLTDAVSTIVPEIERQVETVPSESSHCDNSPVSSTTPQDSSVPREDGGTAKCAGMDSLTPTLAAVSISPSSMMSERHACDESNGAAEANQLAETGASELGRVAENECASSLVADLLAPCDRMTGAGAFLPPATNSDAPFRLDPWGNDLEEAIRTDGLADGVCQLRSSDGLSFDYQDDKSPSGTTGASDDERNLDGSPGGAGHDESDEGDTKGSEGAFTLMEIDDLEILTEQTHYCNICSKGFKRDANLRMHMRSHGGKYKSSTALVRSERPPKVVQEMVGGKPTRYSCPFVGCSRNMRHPKFQALKTMLCLKNHYRRSHCAKTLKCSICKSKQFSVVADLKTHEKHCGSDKWACSCGTTFSRKEKLYGHVSLFVGHVPVDASTAANVALEVATSAAVQAQMTNDKDASAAQNAALNIWSEW